MRKKDSYCTQFFSALANPLRIAIIQSLVRKEKTVNQLTNELKRERTLISHNLADLLAIKIINFKKRKQERLYYANKDMSAPLFYLLQYFVCPGCSIRATCKLLRRNNLNELKLQPFNLKTCEGCVR